jgi:hypothetical protein
VTEQREADGEQLLLCRIGARRRWGETGRWWAVAAAMAGGRAAAGERGMWCGLRRRGATVGNCGVARFTFVLSVYLLFFCAKLLFVLAKKRPGFMRPYGPWRYLAQKGKRGGIGCMPI